MGSLFNFLPFEPHIDILPIWLKFDPPVGGVCVKLLGGIPEMGETTQYGLQSYMVQPKIA